MRLLLPHVYTRLLKRLAPAHWVVYFYKVNSNTLDINLHWLIIPVKSENTLEWYDPFLRVLCFLNVSDVFGGVPKFSASFQIVLALAVFSVLSNICRDVRSYLRVFYCLAARLAALLLGYWSSQSSRFSWGFFKVFGRNDPRLQKTSWGVYSLTSVFLVPRRVSVFPPVLCGGEDKIEVIEEIEINSLPFFITNLPCDVVTL